MKDGSLADKLKGISKVNVHDNDTFHNRLGPNQRLRIKNWLEHNSQAGTLNIVCKAFGEPMRIWRDHGALVFQESVDAVLLALNLVMHGMPNKTVTMVQIFSDAYTVGQIITLKRESKVPNIMQYRWESKDDKNPGFGKTVLHGGFTFEKTPAQPAAFVAHVDEPAEE